MPFRACGSILAMPSSLSGVALLPVAALSITGPAVRRLGGRASGCAHGRETGTA